MSKQPAPVDGVRDVTPQVIADLQDRARRGIAKYGKPLQTHNGRDALWDAYEEALDLVQYLRQAILEKDPTVGRQVAVIKLTIPAVPVAQPRQRHAVIGGHIRNYTPSAHPVNAYKAAIMAAAAEAGIEPLDGPISVDVRFYLPRPKRLMRRKDPAGPIPHTARPDVDNLWKSTADALSGLAWRDDSQVCRTRASKWYAEKDGVPRVEIEISEVAQEIA